MPGSLQRSRRTRESGQDEGLSLRLVFLQLVPLLTPPPLLLTPPFGNLFPALDTRKVAGPGRGLASSWGRRTWAQVLCPHYVPEFNGVAGQIGVWGRAGDTRAWRVCGQRARLAPGPLLARASRELPTPGCTRWKVSLPTPATQRLIFFLTRVQSAKLNPKKGSIQSHFLLPLISSFPISLPLTISSFQAQNKQLSRWHSAIRDHFPSR